MEPITAFQPDDIDTSLEQLMRAVRGYFSTLGGYWEERLFPTNEDELRLKQWFRGSLWSLFFFVEDVKGDQFERYVALLHRKYGDINVVSLTPEKAKSIVKDIENLLWLKHYSPLKAKKRVGNKELLSFTLGVLMRKVEARCKLIEDLKLQATDLALLASVPVSTLTILINNEKIEAEKDLSGVAWVITAEEANRYLNTISRNVGKKTMELEDWFQDLEVSGKTHTERR